MVDFVKLSKTAQGLILANGRAISLVKHSSAESGLRHRGRDKSQDVTLTKDSNGNDITGVFTSYKKTEVDGIDIKRGDKKLLVYAEGISQDLSDFDEVRDGTQDWAIIDVDTIQPSSLILIYKLQVRR